MSRTLRVDTMLYGGAALIDRLLGFFMLPLLTRAIAPSDYGAWTQTTITAGMLVPLVLFGLPTAVVRYFAASAGAASSRRLFVVLAVVPLTLWLACALLLWPAAGALAQLVYGEGGREALVLPLLGLLAADVTSEYAMAWLRAAGRIDAIAGALIVRSAVRYGVVLLLVAAGDAVLVDWLGTFALAQAALAAALLAIAAIALRRAAAPAQPLAAPRAAEVLHYAAPLVLLAALGALNAYLDRFVLVRWLGLDTVAVYAAAASLCSIPAMFHTVLGFTLFPVLARHWAEGRRDDAGRLLATALRVFLFLCLPVSLLIALTGPWLLPHLTTAAYVVAPAVFVLLGISVAALGVYQVLLYALLLDGRSHQVLALAALATTGTLVLNLLLATRYGAVGAAASAALSNLLLVVLAARLARSVLTWRFPWAGLWTVAWRAALAALPWLVLPVASSWPAAAAALLISAALYLGLDLGRSGSILRTMVAK